MAQKLFIKMPGGGQKAVQIIRSWGTSGGNSVFLHSNGRYAYKDDSPLRNAGELDILPGNQRERALAWWNRAGKAESEVYYKAQNDKEREAAGDFRQEVPFAAELDAVTYIRRKTGGVKTLAPSAPHAWMEWFPARPDWWGQAKTISFKDYTYEMVDEGTEEQGPPGTDLKSVPKKTTDKGTDLKSVPNVPKGEE